MQVTISPSLLSGSVTAPASKSAMQRICAAALSTERKVTINNAGISNDDKAAIGILQHLGASVHWLNSTTLQLDCSHINTAAVSEVNCGESGLGIRMFTPILATYTSQITVMGMGSLLKRPMHFFDEILPLIAVKVQSNNGHLPLTIQGPLVPTDITVDGSLSSQFLTGMLLAFAKQLPNSKLGSVIISVTNLKSKPYIDLTLQIMEQFGLPIPVNYAYQRFQFFNNNLAINQQPITVTVESDWSGGAFLLVAAAINGNLVVKGLDVNSTQADKAVLQALIDCGCRMSISDNEIAIEHLPLQPFHFNATDCPDLFPPLVALASYCKGKSVIEGVSRLAFKESNRALTLQQEFAKMGVEIILQDDLMIINGGNNLQGAIVSSCHDHRIAMACAVAATKAVGNTTILAADAIDKSYPNFYQHLQSIGGSIDFLNYKLSSHE